MIRNSDIHRLRGLFAKRLIATMDMLKKTVGTVADLTVFGTCQQLWDTRELHLVSLDYGGETREVGAIDINIDQDLVA